VCAAPASATVIEIGDLLYLDPTTQAPKPASGMIDQGSEALNQDTFQELFLGVAEQQSRAGDTDQIRIATAGEFEFDCPSGTFNLGQLVGADENAGGDGLLDQQVAAVASESLAIGRVARAEAVAVTSVWVRIKSTIMDGGVPAQVAGSSSGPV
jgi:hypothetical protein